MTLLYSSHEMYISGEMYKGASTGVWPVPYHSVPFPVVVVQWCRLWRLYVNGGAGLALVVEFVVTVIAGAHNVARFFKETLSGLG